MLIDQRLLAPRRHRWLTPPVVLAVVVLCAVTAVAYFVAAGFGHGSGTNGSLQPVTAVAFAGGDTESSSLYPGGPSADVIVRLNNPNAFSVKLVSVTGNGTIVADGGHASCTTTGVTFTNQIGLSISLPSGSTLLHFATAASMSTASLNGCQGATFSIPVTVTVHSQ
jgi:uncharacterized protein (UPF0333 family)